ncbi:MAG TPA: ATP-binding cassette domain-containing protein [Kofleriaceae bacterium]|nr:ATP-binding cassette domain-containing protein [Kofleriaceae bacterium]
MRIELRGISKHYGKVVALDRIDLDIPSGARVALLGANGSGKTTLTRVIMGLLKYDGQLALGGMPAQPRPPELNARIAYVPQVAPPWIAPVRDVVAAVAALRGVPGVRFENAATRMGIDLRAVAHRPFRGLSGGTRQKVLLALALATPVALSILDEPTASLDAASRHRFFEIAQDAWAGATVVLCSHRLDELRSLVDHVVLLADGRIAWSGPAERYLADHLRSMIELRVAGDEEAWLRKNGFSRTSDGWWRRPVDAAEKLTLVPAALAALGNRIRDFAIHDTEHVDA